MEGTVNRSPPLQWPGEPSLDMSRPLRRALGTDEEAPPTRSAFSLSRAFGGSTLGTTAGSASATTANVETKGGDDSSGIQEGSDPVEQRGGDLSWVIRPGGEGEDGLADLPGIAMSGREGVAQDPRGYSISPGDAQAQARKKGVPPFRSVRKVASLFRKQVTGTSASEARSAAALASQQQAAAQAQVQVQVQAQAQAQVQAQATSTAGADPRARAFDARAGMNAAERAAARAAADAALLGTTGGAPGGGTSSVSGSADCGDGSGASTTTSSGVGSSGSGAAPAGGGGDAAASGATDNTGDEDFALACMWQAGQNGMEPDQAMAASFFERAADKGARLSSPCHLVTSPRCLSAAARSASG